MNTEQFQQFIEMMTRSLESQNGSMAAPKENNHVKVKDFDGMDEEDPLKLNSLKQQEYEKVDIYAAKFKRLLSQVNLDKGLLDRFIVKMFLNGLKKNNATFVAIAASKDLNEAISAARRVEASNYYGQHQLKARKSQQKLGSELSDLRERIDDIALNYATLTDKFKNIKERTKSLNSYEEEEYNSERSNTFDKFDYEEDEELDEVESCILEEYLEENPALFYEHKRGTHRRS
ncbi:hypothetical protein C2G38_2175571 [Gigaspora rosea]|uniref:Retrotransposon gag domain-containing protein n=1 Tax=Gigaspora rosea TaxID=44941 RepID=A0A397VLD8_9GLOM|nr:hypothetical protein C2G38_2175571 [Gigaspora rosea]